MTEVEVVPYVAPVLVDVQHTHVTVMGEKHSGPKQLTFEHHHLVERDNPEHIHGLPKVTSGARFQPAVLKGIQGA